MAISQKRSYYAEKTQRVAFSRLTSTTDAEGVSTDAWTAIRSAWASVEHRSGAQKWGNGGYSAVITDLFTIGYVPGWIPDASMRLTWDGKNYDIESAENIREENQDIEIRAVFVGPAQGR